jgi:hypothetical protein
VWVPQSDEGGHLFSQGVVVLTQARETISAQKTKKKIKKSQFIEK